VLDRETCDIFAFRGTALPFIRDGVDADRDSRSRRAAEILLLPATTLLTTLGPIKPLPLLSTTSPSTSRLATDVVDPFTCGLSVSSELRGEL
jgi:hypothetical protein